MFDSGHWSWSSPLPIFIIGITLRIPKRGNKNHAGQAPVVDWVFGTLHRRSGWPDRYGCDGNVADVSSSAQLASPWRRERHHPPPPDVEAELGAPVVFGPCGEHRRWPSDSRLRSLERPRIADPTAE